MNKKKKERKEKGNKKKKKFPYAKQTKSNGQQESRIIHYVCMWYYSFSVSEHKRRSSLNAKYINSWQLFMILFIFFFKEKVKSNLKGKKKKMPSREVSFRSACNQLPRHLNWVRSGCSIPMSKRHPFFVGGWIDPAIFFFVATRKRSTFWECIH